MWGSPQPAREEQQQGRARESLWTGSVPWSGGSEETPPLGPHPSLKEPLTHQADKVPGSVSGQRFGAVPPSPKESRTAQARGLSTAELPGTISEAGLMPPGGETHSSTGAGEVYSRQDAGFAGGRPRFNSRHPTWFPEHRMAATAKQRDSKTNKNTCTETGVLGPFRTVINLDYVVAALEPTETGRTG